MRESYMSQRSCIKALLAGRLACAMLLPLCLGITLNASAKEYSIKKISDERHKSREPVIGDTGIAAWTAYAAPQGEIQSEIIIYTNGVTRPLLSRLPKGNTANMRPYLQSSNLVWSATLGGDTKNPSWILREVPSPERDEPVTELPAVYDLKFGANGEQIWVEPSTNKPNPEKGVTDPAANATNAVATDAEAPKTVADAANNPSASTNAVEAEAKPEVQMKEPPPDTTPVTEEARRMPSGSMEIMLWRPGEAELERITRDNRNDLGPSIWGSTIAWQKAKGWPFGWEIMAWINGTRIQLTTNYYYDMAPQVQGNQIVWYGWDGQDFEIFLYDTILNSTKQITSNHYDDVSPRIWNNVIVWEGYAGVDGDIFIYENGQVRKLSENIEDDLNPRIWNGQVVWQGFDGDDFEIYLYDGKKTRKLTSNTYDDLDPDIRDNVICWMGYYDNWDSEIFVWDGGPNAIRLTDNDYEDREPKTAGGKIIWQTEEDEKSLIYLAEPK